MARNHLIIEAGCECMEVMYPRISKGDSRTVRKGKKDVTKDAKQRMNDKAAYRKLEMELAANYRANDLVLCLTFDDAHLPKDRAGVKAAVKKFTAALRKEREKRGQTLTYHYTEEHKHLSEDESMNGRWHIHMVMNATGDDYRLISTLWARGHADIQRLRVDRDKNFESLARYMTKEPRDKVGHRLWSSSQGAKKPRRELRQVGNGETIKIPRNVMVLSDTGEVETVYGSYRFVRYIRLKDAGAAPKSRRRK